MFGKFKTGVEYIIAGLGNPGPEYEKTRHNAGFRIVDYICEKHGLKPNRLKHMSLCVKGDFGGHTVLFMKPQTYMNNSGESIADASRFYKVPPQNVIVISDDTSFDAGKARLRKSGSAGGHNGLKSIIEHLGTDGFPRLKIGVGLKPAEYDLAAWVLGKMSDEELKACEAKYDSLEKSLCLIMDGEFDKAVQSANSNK